jgi:hypothetical protein
MRSPSVAFHETGRRRIDRLADSNLVLAEWGCPHVTDFGHRADYIVLMAWGLTRFQES